ncbi:MAG: hypothetical protein EOO81_04915 [Oxalobacteraceae bacterium]|nr:MAG: hypothetical protein EOO81_04915 [Oxalobacteraceae bacterium]
MAKGEVIVRKHELSVEGLQIRYQVRNGSTILEFDAFSCCALLAEAGLIDAFESDGNEPVVTYQPNDGVATIQKPWCRFVKAFNFSYELALAIAQWHYHQKEPQPPSKGSSDKLLPRDVLPPAHLYNLHNYYYEHICSRDKGSAAGASIGKDPSND